MLKDIECAYTMYIFILTILIYTIYVYIKVGGLCIYVYRQYILE